jgi:hypothetical protein
MPGNALFQIPAGFARQPFLEPLPGSAEFPWCMQLGEGFRLDTAHDAPARDLSGKKDAVSRTAQRNEDAVLKRNRLWQAIQAFPHPFDVAMQKGIRLFQTALDRQRDNDSAAGAADSQSQSASGRMATNLHRCAQSPDVPLVARGQQ